jgi:tRNA threonylcarbamoyladenosine biosynthesis protein TsaB
MSIILAIESSTDIASVALIVAGSPETGDDRILHRQVAGVQSHSQTVLPMVQALLAEAGIALASCSAIAFGAGPGSFTGVRTACGIAQGLAYGSNLPVVGVDTLEAAAQACRDATGAADVLVLLDARMGEVYWAQYRWLDADDGADSDPDAHADPDAAGGAWRVVSAPRLDAPALVAASGGVQACGSGLTAHPAVFESAPFAATARADIMPHAVAVATLAARLFAAGKAVAARDAQPVYLRNDVALTTAERAVRRAEAAA